MRSDFLALTSLIERGKLQNTASNSLLRGDMESLKPESRRMKNQI